MVHKLPARVLASLEHLQKKALRLRDRGEEEKARKVKRFVAAVVACYQAMGENERSGYYVSRNVRFRGIWRNWRDAGLQHLEDAALIRFCGFNMACVNELATLMIPHLPKAIHPNSGHWRKADPLKRPVCDALDCCVLVLREIATIGYQHMLESDMGIPRSSLSKYLRVGKGALFAVLKEHSAARTGWFDEFQGDGGLAQAKAAMAALEAQHGSCPLLGAILALAIDGTVTPVMKPDDPDLDVLYFSISKRYHGVNSILVVSPFGTVMMYRLGMPGVISDTRGAEPIFNWLFDPAVNPHNIGGLADYGFAEYCSCTEDFPPWLRPWAKGKDILPSDPNLRVLINVLSRWVTTCRQYNEWVNGSAKRGFPRWQVKRDIRHLPQILKDLELYIMLYNFRVRKCQWSQTRTVYMEAAKQCFDMQYGMVYDEETGVFILHDDRGEPDVEGGDDDF
jgi:hypothetical protein